MVRDKVDSVAFDVLAKVVLNAFVIALLAIVEKFTETETLSTMYAHAHVVDHVDFGADVFVMLAYVLQEKLVYCCLCRCSN